MRSDRVRGRAGACGGREVSKCVQKTRALIRGLGQAASLCISHCWALVPESACLPPLAESRVPTLSCSPSAPLRRRPTPLPVVRMRPSPDERAAPLLRTSLRRACSAAVTCLLLVRLSLHHLSEIICIPLSPLLDLSPSLRRMIIYIMNASLLWNRRNRFRPAAA
eukprot:3208825-Pleurochrysis_carterae.AAC.1